MGLDKKQSRDFDFGRVVYKACDADLIVKRGTLVQITCFLSLCYNTYENQVKVYSGVKF